MPGTGHGYQGTRRAKPKSKAEAVRGLGRRGGTNQHRAAAPIAAGMPCTPRNRRIDGSAAKTAAALSRIPTPAASQRVRSGAGPRTSHQPSSSKAHNAGPQKKDINRSITGMLSGATAIRLGEKYRPAPRAMSSGTGQTRRDVGGGTIAGWMVVVAIRFPPEERLAAHITN